MTKKQYGLMSSIIKDLENHGIHVPTEEECEAFDKALCFGIMHTIGCDFPLAISLCSYYNDEYARKELQ